MNDVQGFLFEAADMGVVQGNYEIDIKGDFVNGFTSLPIEVHYDHEVTCHPCEKGIVRPRGIVMIPSNTKYEEDVANNVYKTDFIFRDILFTENIEHITVTVYDG